MSKHFKSGDKVRVKYPSDSKFCGRFLSPVTVCYVLESQYTGSAERVVAMRGSLSPEYEGPRYFAPIEDVYHVDDPEVTGEICVPVDSIKHKVGDEEFRFVRYDDYKNCVVFKR